ncbi:MAG: preprotein translocase subunit SecE [Saprospiraceae bacterium]|jgi:preprotein translocase subunit SecE|nr:preprotein translocase subunit SecE [Saprospiraceae bacterium]
MEKIKLYLTESYNELMHKVTWPTWPNLTSTTVVVLVSSLLIAILIALMDLISTQGTHLIYGI